MGGKLKTDRKCEECGDQLPLLAKSHQRWCTARCRKAHYDAVSRASRKHPCKSCGAACWKRDDGLCGHCRAQAKTEARRVTSRTKCGSCGSSCFKRVAGDPPLCGICRAAAKRSAHRAKPKAATCESCGSTWHQTGNPKKRCPPCIEKQAAKRAATRRTNGGWRLHRYGITQAQFEQMIADQAGGCALCAVQLTLEPKKKNTACLDHCHASNELRGVLCPHCNAGLGQFRDNAQAIANAVTYLTNGQTHRTSAAKKAPQDQDQEEAGRYGLLFLC